MDGWMDVVGHYQSQNEEKQSMDSFSDCQIIPWRRVKQWAEDGRTLCSSLSERAREIFAYANDSCTVCCRVLSHDPPSSSLSLSSFTWRGTSCSFCSRRILDREREREREAVIAISRFIQWRANARVKWWRGKLKAGWLVQARVKGKH